MIIFKEVIAVVSDVLVELESLLVTITFTPVVLAAFPCESGLRTSSVVGTTSAYLPSSSLAREAKLELSHWRVAKAHGGSDNVVELLSDGPAFERSASLPHFEPSISSANPVGRLATVAKYGKALGDLLGFNGHRRNHEIMVMIS